MDIVQYRAAIAAKTQQFCELLNIDLQQFNIKYMIERNTLINDKLNIANLYTIEWNLDKDNILYKIECNRVL